MINVKVRYKGGNELATALPQELIESGDVIQLPSKQWLRLSGTDAHGTKVYEEVDAPDEKAGKVEEVTVEVDGKATAAGRAFHALSQGLKFPEPGPSKPLIGSDGKPLPPPKGKAHKEHKPTA